MSCIVFHFRLISLMASLKKKHVTLHQRKMKWLRGLQMMNDIPVLQVNEIVKTVKLYFQPVVCKL